MEEALYTSSTENFTIQRPDELVKAGNKEGRYFVFTESRFVTSDPAEIEFLDLMIATKASISRNIRKIDTSAAQTIVAAIQQRKSQMIVGGVNSSVDANLKREIQERQISEELGSGNPIENPGSEPTPEPEKIETEDGVVPAENADENGEAQKAKINLGGKK